jgi:hypothetical protein
MTRFRFIALVVMLVIGCSTPKSACGVSSTQPAVEPESSGTSWRDAEGRVHVELQTVTPVREKP